MARDVQITFDCADPARLAAFWAEALGYRLQDPPRVSSRGTRRWRRWVCRRRGATTPRR